MAEKYDEWHALPANNQYAFYTAHPTEAAQICKYLRTPINRNAGIITIAPECQVSTQQHRIFRSHSEQIKKGYSFHIEAITETPLHHESTTVIKRKHTGTLPPVHDENLKKEEQEAKQLELLAQENTTLWVIIGVGCGSTLTIVGIMITISLWKKTMKPPTESIEMQQLASDTSVQPTPAIRTWPSELVEDLGDSM